jgi:hypothetical protein
MTVVGWKNVNRIDGYCQATAATDEHENIKELLKL